MKEPLSIRICAALLMLCSIAAFSISKDERFITVGVLMFPFMLNVLLKFRIGFNKYTGYLLYFLLAIPIFLKYLSLPDNADIFSQTALVGYYLILCAILTAYKRKAVKEFIAIYFFSLFVLIIAGFSTQAGYFDLSVALHFLISVFFLRLLFQQQYKVVRADFNIRRLLVIIIIFGFVLVVFSSLNHTMVWLDGKVTATLYQNQSGMNYAGMLDETSLNVTGDLKLSDKVVLRVFTKASIERLRSKGFIDYKNGKWFAGAKKEFVKPVDAKYMAKYLPKHLDAFGSIFQVQKLRSSLKPKSMLYCRVETATDFNTVYFAPPGTRILMTDIAGLQKDQYGILYPEAASANMDYGIVAATDGQIEVADGKINPAYLKVPEYLKPDVARLTMKLTSPHKNVLGKCLAVESYFHQNFKYSLKFRPTMAGDPMQEFLLGRKAAHCEYFATSMVLMLRTAHIPARYVTGFLVHEYHNRAGYYVVRERDAHAWVEAFVPVKGWVTFDPTPSDSLFDELLGADSVGVIGQFFDYLAYKLGESKQFFVQGDVLGLLKWIWKNILAILKWFVTHPVYLVLLLLLTLPPRVYKRLAKYIRLKRTSGKEERLKQVRTEIVKLQAYLQRFDNILKKQKIERLQSLTLFEYGDYLRGLNLDAEILQTAIDFVEQYCRLRYAGSEISAEDFAMLEANIVRLELLFGK